MGNFTHLAIVPDGAVVTPVRSADVSPPPSICLVISDASTTLAAGISRRSAKISQDKAASLADKRRGWLPVKQSLFGMDTGLAIVHYPFD